MKHHKKTINRLKVIRDILSLLLFLLLMSVFFYHREQNRYVSPCPDAGCSVFTHVVYASDDDSELQKITAYIIEKFEPEGRHVAVWALACFISESKLNPEAYHFNTNNTWDYGVAQWNQVHGQTIDELRGDWRKQIDLAYDLYMRRGKGQWYGSACK